MGKSAGSPPPAPDPTVTARAQADANADTARLTARLNRVNQVTPYGTVSYSPGAQPMDRGAWENQEVERARTAWNAAHPAMPGANLANDPMYNTGGGDNFDNSGVAMPGSVASPIFDESEFRRTLAGREVPAVPGQDEWTQTTTLNPEQQRLLDLTTRGQTTYGETANNLLDAVRGQLSQPVNVDWAAERDRALSAQMERINPTFTQAEEGLRQRLMGQGLAPGSEGWDREFRTFNQGRNDALLAADLNAGNTVGQAIQQQTALRAMPLNEVSALLSGSQVQSPQAYQPAAATVAPTDVLGAYNQQYQGQLAQWQAQQQQQNAGMGGLFGLAGTLGGAAIRRFGLPF